LTARAPALLGYVTDLVKIPLQPHAIAIISSIVTLAALGGGYYLLARPDWKESHPSLYAFCYVEAIWFCLRLLAGSSARKSPGVEEWLSTISFRTIIIYPIFLIAAHLIV
jgi:hypothetical protein